MGGTWLPVGLAWEGSSWLPSQGGAGFRYALTRKGAEAWAKGTDLSRLGLPGALGRRPGLCDLGLGSLWGASCWTRGGRNGGGGGVW